MRSRKPKQSTKRAAVTAAGTREVDIAPRKKEIGMNMLVKWLVKSKLSKVLRAEALTGHRTQVCLGLYLVVVILQMIGAQMGWPQELAEVWEILKDAAVGAGGLALAAKVTRSGPEAKKK